MKIDKKLITSYQDEIHLSHIVIEGTNKEIGYQLGCLAKEVHNISKFSDMDRSVIERQYNYIKTNYPEHYARMTGYAGAYGRSLDDQNSDFSFFGEVPNGTACSAVYYPPALTITGRGNLSRNLDFSIPSNIKKPSFPFKHSYLIEMHPDSGYSSISLFCFEVFGLALEGINSEGLTVIHLADNDTKFHHENLATRETAKGFNEFLPVQFLLDTCSTAKEAKEALQRTEHYHVAFATHLLVADKEGNSFVFEYSPDGTNKIFIQGSKAVPQKITNFQLNRLSDEKMANELKSRSSENGFDRYLTLQKQIDQVKFPITERAAKEINTSVYVYADTENVLDRTIFHSIYDMTLKTVQISLLPEKNRINNEFFKFSL
jgi:predicted choloylglycine hydrolase